MEGSLSLIKQVLPHMTPSEAKVANYILQYSNKVVEENITNLAEHAGTSPAAVVRLCKRLGLSGYPELRIALAKEVFSVAPLKNSPYMFDIEHASDINDICSMMIETVSESISSLRPVLSAKKIELAVDAIIGARFILLSGIGASGLVAADFQQKLVRIGLAAFAPSDPDLQIVQACSLTKEDVVIAFSYSGETNHTLRTAVQGKRAGATLIAITRIGANSLSKLADIVLLVPDTEALYRQGATLSRINQMVIVDILYSALVPRRKDAAKHIRQTWQAVSHISDSHDL
ncbi:MAG: MurR/RpiR family transcriptional regulator [Sphaerochaetaceae bacterium]|jgi:DNA-binding MurR/RpiR family transcriptional regulator